MASSLKAKFEAEAEAQRAASTPPSKPEPTGVKALMKKHKEFVNPPPPKVSEPYVTFLQLSFLSFSFRFLGTHPTKDKLVLQKLLM